MTAGALAAITPALAITPSACLAALTTFVGWYLSRRVQEVHVLTNSNLSAALAAVAELERQVAELKASPPGPPVPPP